MGSTRRRERACPCSIACRFRTVHPTHLLISTQVPAPRVVREVLTHRFVSRGRLPTGHDQCINPGEELSGASYSLVELRTGHDAGSRTPRFQYFDGTRAAGDGLGFSGRRAVSRGVARSGGSKRGPQLCTNQNFMAPLRVDLHAIDAMPARWRASTAALSALDALVDFHSGHPDAAAEYGT